MSWKSAPPQSGVLYELTEKLKTQQIPYLAIRLDRKTLQGSTFAFGESQALPESPVKCLDAYAGKQFSVLILDQLDAIRWTSSHVGESLDICKAMLREAKAARVSGSKLAVVLCCRTYDLQHDPQLSAWLNKQSVNPNKKD